MKQESLLNRLALCSWSLQPDSPADLLRKIQSTGIRRVQLALDPLREQPDQWNLTPELLRSADIEIVSGMFGCVGEDYSTLESIQRTGGIAPDDTWQANWINIQTTAAIARNLGLKLVTFHAGFLPHQPSDPAWAKMQDRLNRVAEAFHENGVAVAFETGQETAAILAEVLRTLNRANVGINFDPANMILYDKGNPIEALRLLGPWVRQVHIKDARRTRIPGQWGEEVVVGTGDVDWPDFFKVLEEIQFSGNLCIEREAGDRRVEDIREALSFLKKVPASYL